VWLKGEEGESGFKGGRVGRGLEWGVRLADVTGARVRGEGTPLTLWGILAGWFLSIRIITRLMS
jgi:hypothetical protein